MQIMGLKGHFTVFWSFLSKKGHLDFFISC